HRIFAHVDGNRLALPLDEEHHGTREHLFYRLIDGVDRVDLKVCDGPFQEFLDGPRNGVRPLHLLQRVDDVRGHLVLKKTVDKKEAGSLAGDLDLAFDDVKGEANPQPAPHLVQVVVKLADDGRLRRGTHRRCSFTWA